MPSKALGTWLGLCAAILISGCSADPSPLFRGESGVRPGHVELSRLSAQPGLSESHASDPELGSRSVDVWLPPSGEPKLLITFLHGAVARQRGKRFGSEGMTRELIRCLVEPALGELEPVVIAPRNADGEWWEESETRFVLGLSEAAKRRFPSVGKRHLVVGYSNGGIAAWYFARLYPEYFSAVVPIAANDSIAGESPLPVYAIHGTRDEVFPIAGVRAAIRALERGRGDVRLVEKYRGGHYDPCSYAPELSGVPRWLEQRGLAGR